MTTYYKAVRPDGTDFWSGEVRWAPNGSPAVLGTIVKHPTATAVGDSAAQYLSVSTVPTDCTGMEWPCRLLEVETVDGCEPVTPDPVRRPHKRAATAWRVVREVDPLLTLGPQAEHVVALIDRAGRLTSGEVHRLPADWVADWAAVRSIVARGVARDTARAAGRDAARFVASYAAWYAARDPTWYAAWDAALALVVRDLLDSATYDTLTRPWRQVIGPIHPDDGELT